MIVAALSLAVEIVVWMVLAAAVGLGTGWLLWRWWPAHPITPPPDPEELRRLRADLWHSEEHVADLRAELSTLRAELAAATTRPDPVRPAARRAMPPGTERSATERTGTERTSAGPIGRRPSSTEPTSTEPSSTEPNGTGPSGTAAMAPAGAVAASPAASLRDISGIGPKLERLLQRHGVHSVAELAALDDDAVARLDAAIGGVRGRIRRDDWVGQARRLQHGAGTSAGDRSR